MTLPTKFVREDDGKQRGFNYHDSDGDVLKVWRYSDCALRFHHPNAAEGVAIEAADAERFLEELTRLSQAPCPNCSGSGVVK